MGINNLAVQTFSSSGSQSVCRANKADSSRQITSDFISRCPIKYINGSGISLINGSIKNLPSSLSPGVTDVDTFRIPNNIDAISDIILNWTINIPTPTSSGFDCSGIFYSKTLLLDSIQKVDIKHGGLVIQTIYPGDIYMRNYSELGYLTNHEDSFNLKRDASYVDMGSIIGHETVSGETINFSLSIPFIGRNTSKDRSFLQTGAFANILSVIINYNSYSTTDISHGQVVPLLQSNQPTQRTTIESRLYILSHLITDTEKNFMKQNIVNRVLNTSVGIPQLSIYSKITRSNTGFTRYLVDLDSIDINVTHIMFCLNVSVFQGDVTPSTFLTTDGSNIRISLLKSNNAISSGINRLSSTWGEAINDSSANIASNIRTPDVLGVFNGWLNNAELVLGNETTGEIYPTALNSNQEEFSLKYCDKNFYILKLADNAFSTAGIPFSRIKNKILVLNINNKFFNNPAFGSGATKRSPDLSICACGTTIQIINNNNISFSYI
jgi:hypothetical protein